MQNPTALLKQTADRIANLNQAAIAAADGPAEERAERITVLAAEAERVLDSIEFANTVLGEDYEEQIQLLHVMLQMAVDSVEEVAEFC